MRDLCINNIMIDLIDRNILDHLQQHGQATNAELGEAVHISPSQAGRRKARLEADGYIIGYQAQLDPSRIDLSIQAFIQLSLKEHSRQYATRLHSFLERQSTIANIWTMTGRADYLLQVFCRDLSELNSLIHDVLLSHENIAHVESQIVMDHLKANAGLPVKD